MYIVIKKYELYIKHQTFNNKGSLGSRVIYTYIKKYLEY